MNPRTFNEKFEHAIAEHPESAAMEAVFGKWRVAPLFDYETTWDKEVALLAPRMGCGIADLAAMWWPFGVFRLSLIERDVPVRETQPELGTNDYKTNLIARRDAGMLQLMIFWRNWKDAPGDVMLHIYSTGDGTDGAATLYSERHGWMNRRLSHASVQTMAGSALASFGSFLEDVMLPKNHIVEVRPNQPGRSVEWLKARTHYTLITHGHPANKKDVAAGARVASDPKEELARSAHNRRAHLRTYRHDRFTYARGKTIKVREAWIGPREWQDEGGRQIYLLLEPSKWPER